MGSHGCGAEEPVSLLSGMTGPRRVPRCCCTEGSCDLLRLGTWEADTVKSLHDCRTCQSLANAHLDPQGGAITPPGLPKGPSVSGNLYSAEQIQRNIGFKHQVQITSSGIGGLAVIKVWGPVFVALNKLPEPFMN